jgi:hypothetical protein
MSRTTTRNIVSPSYPIAPEEYTARFMEQYTNVLRLFSATVANSVNAPKVHGSYYDTTTQTNPVANVERLMKLNSTVSAYGTKIGSPTSRVFINETGVYNIQFSAQFDKTGGGADSAYVWLKINGAAVPHSAGKIVISGTNAETIAAWNYVTVLSGGDYFEIAWLSNDTTMRVVAIPATSVIPEVPSVIVTVTWVSNISV